MEAHVYCLRGSFSFSQIIRRSNNSISSSSAAEMARAESNWASTSCPSPLTALFCTPVPRISLTYSFPLHARHWTCFPCVHYGPNLHITSLNLKDLYKNRVSLVAQLGKNPPAKRGTWVWSLGWEDPLEKGKTTHSSILAWRIPWTV